MRGLAAHPVTEMTSRGLVHSFHTFDFACSQRGDACDHLVGDTDCPQRTVLTHNRRSYSMGTLSPPGSNQSARAARPYRACPAGIRGEGRANVKGVPRMTGCACRP